MTDNEIEKMLHAVVIAVRDDKRKYDLLRIVQSYPRLTNKENPYLPLLDEIKRLQGIVDEQDETICTLRMRLEIYEPRI